MVIAVISPCSSAPPRPLEVVGPLASVLTSEVEGNVAMVASVLPLLSMKTGTRILVLGYSGACANMQVQSIGPSYRETKLIVTNLRQEHVE